MNTISYEKPSKKMPVSNAGFVTEVETNDRYTAMNGENAGNDAEWIKVNMLPTRTWNRLKVNESYVKTPEIKSFCRCEMNDAARNIACSAGGHRPEEYDDIESGMGSAVAELGRSADAAFAGKNRTDARNCLQTDTILISTEDGKRYVDPMVMTYKYEPQKGSSFNRIIIDAAPGSSLTAVIVLESSKDVTSKCVTGRGVATEQKVDAQSSHEIVSRGSKVVAGQQAALQRDGADTNEDTAVLRVLVNAQQNSDVRIYMVQMLGSKTVSLADVGIQEADNARVEFVRAELGGSRSYTGVLADLSGDGSYFEADTSYNAVRGRIVDMDYTARHEGRNTQSLMNAAGVIGNSSEKIFRGTIDFLRGCAGAKGDEKEDVLLLGDDLVNKTVPLILCKEEDVEGNHGASIGELADDVLFYMGTRGISREQAEKLVAKAKLLAVISKIPSDEVRKSAAEFVG